MNYILFLTILKMLSRLARRFYSSDRKVREEISRRMGQNLTLKLDEESLAAYKAAEKISLYYLAISIGDQDILNYVSTMEKSNNWILKKDNLCEKDE